MSGAGILVDARMLWISESLRTDIYCLMKLFFRVQKKSMKLMFKKLF